MSATGGSPDRCGLYFCAMYSPRTRSALAVSLAEQLVRMKFCSVLDRPLLTGLYRGKAAAVIFGVASAHHLSHCLGRGVITLAHAEYVKPAPAGLGAQCRYCQLGLRI